ncbi:MAG: glucose-6-phosphate isomerase [Tannerella sp.]|jgi:glucose-6-phosphate isomerase|nr:glucose-6-phosphate isomerase [Tannerella sp.]
MKDIFNPGIDIQPVMNPMGFTYGSNVFGPQAELRRLDDIRSSLMNPHCEGPEMVYAIAMDVGKNEHRRLLNELHLLYGVVTYSAGKLGNEPVRSQGHIHKVSSYSGSSTPEVYEVWSGKAIIYMQESDGDEPGRCFAVQAAPGDVVIVPPYWLHATVSASLDEPLTFGAWCDRDYGFIYDGVRRHQGIAWFPVYNGRNELEWIANPHYHPSELTVKSPRSYEDLAITGGTPIYTLFEEDPEIFRFVPDPKSKKEVWNNFVP